MPKEKAEPGNSINKFSWDVVHSFFKQHSKETTANHKQVSILTNKNEEIKLISTCKNSALDELTKSLATKTNELDEINEKYQKQQYNIKYLHHNLLMQNKKFVELETTYDEARQSLKNQLQKMNEQTSSVNTLLSSKEAECAAYLKDMQTQLDEANLKNSQSEQRISELQVKVLELENLLETKNEEATLERQNVVKKYESVIKKQQRKLERKKNKRIAELENKVKLLGNEKKALQNSLEMEGHKIRDLQRVLNRPISRASPVQEVNVIDHRETQQVVPMVALNAATSSSSSRADTPPIEVDNQVKQNTNRSIVNRAQPFKRPLSSHSNHENQDINNVFKNKLQEIIDNTPSTSAVHNRKNIQPPKFSPSPASTHQFNRSPFPLEDDDYISDDIFPAYIPNKNGGDGQREAKRLRK